MTLKKAPSRRKVFPVDMIREMDRFIDKSFRPKDFYALKDWFSSARGKRPKEYLATENFLRAYTSYYLPLHLPELYWILSQNKERLKFQKKTKLLDLGCGPGTQSMSFWGFLRSEVSDKYEASFLGVDQAKKSLSYYEDWLKRSGVTDRHTVRMNLKKEFTIKGRFDWIVMGHLLNEWGNGPRFRGKKIKFLESLLPNLEDEGYLLLIDVPLREASLDVMKLRDWAAQHPDLQVLAPCPEPEEAVCPLMRSKKGWCYAQIDRRWAKENSLAPWDKLLEKKTRKTLHYNAFSYLLIQKSRKMTQARSHQIAVSDGKKSKLVCDGCRIRAARSPIQFRGEYLQARSPKGTR